jgi:hypothetical protein
MEDGELNRQAAKFAKTREEMRKRREKDKIEIQNLRIQNHENN